MLSARLLLLSAVDSEATIPANEALLEQAAVTGSMGRAEFSEGTDVVTAEAGGAAAADKIGDGDAVDPTADAEMPGAVAETESVEKGGLRLRGGAEARREGICLFEELAGNVWLLAGCA
mmetsp:Transcript_33712/g.61025  ORF Transcript_33712/g.61025 Transcript_33712/m.61025 type:complete len:119 (+) Transcript_33712:136-492(+)